MKIFALILLCSVAYLNAAPTTPAPIDYRERYDRLLLEIVNERIREGERFLERLSNQLKEYQTHKNETVRQSIVRELEFVLPMIKMSGDRFTNEAKRTNLDMLEKYTIEKGKAEAELAYKLLSDIEKEVNKKAAFIFYAANTTVDYRNEYDKLLYQMIQERISRADGLLLGLNRQVMEYQKTKNADVKKRVDDEIAFTLPLLQMAEDHATTELKRTDLNTVERFLYEKAQDEVKLLITHFTQIKAAIDKPATDYFADTTTPRPVDWRSEYDRLLFELTEENLRRADDFLLHLTREVAEYKKSKDASIAKKVTEEVEIAVAVINRALDYVGTELKRTELNHIEKYMLEKARDEATILMKYYKQLETDVKKPAYFVDGDYYASNTTAEVRAVEEKFMSISREVRKYLQNKSDDAKTKIVSEIDAELPKVKDLVKRLQTELSSATERLDKFRVERELLIVRALEVGYTREEARIKA